MTQPPPDTGFAVLPYELWNVIVSYLEQTSSHRLLRVCRSLFHTVGPAAWRRVELAPHPHWIIDEPDGEYTGQVQAGFLRSKRLLHAYAANPPNGQPGAWQFLGCCLELTICEMIEVGDMPRLYRMFPNAFITTIYLGNFLHWYHEFITGEKGGFSVLLGEIEPVSLHTPDLRPRTLCESIPDAVFNRTVPWSSKNITRLNIDCEVHITAIHDNTREHFVDQIFAAHRVKNMDANVWYRTFPNIEELTCGNWFLDLLFYGGYLGDYTRGNLPFPNPDLIDRFKAEGIGGLPKTHCWPKLRSMRIMGYEREYPEITPKCEEFQSIVNVNIWSFLGIFTVLKKIRVEVGSWKRMHKYPGGIDIVPHTETLVALRALQICQEKFNWDVQIEKFMINLRDIEEAVATSETNMFPPYICGKPVVDSPDGLTNLLQFIKTVGWNGFVSIPDATNWWHGQTWGFEPDVVQPQEWRPLSWYWNDQGDSTHGDYLQWEADPAGGWSMGLKTLLSMYYDATYFNTCWEEQPIGLRIYHESCWYRSYLHPIHRYMSPSQYDSRLCQFIALHCMTPESVSLATNNWNRLRLSWSDLNDRITSLCYDGFDYELESITPNTRAPQFNLILHNSRNGDFDLLATMGNLHTVTIVNFMWAFDPETAGAPDPGDTFNYALTLQQPIEGFPAASKSLKKLKLVGEIFFRWLPSYEPFNSTWENESYARDRVIQSFTAPSKAKQVLDLEWISWKYVGDKYWPLVTNASKIGKECIFLSTLNPLTAQFQPIKWETYNILSSWEDVENQGWKVYEPGSGYERFIVSNPVSNLSFWAGVKGDEKLLLWSTFLHPYKDTPYHPISGFTPRYGRHVNRPWTFTAMNPGWFH